MVSSKICQTSGELGGELSKNYQTSHKLGAVKNVLSRKIFGKNVAKAKILGVYSWRGVILF